MLTYLFYTQNEKNMHFKKERKLFPTMDNLFVNIVCKSDTAQVREK